MDVNEIVIGELRSARAALVTQRSELDAAIRQIDGMIAERRGVGVPAPIVGMPVPVPSAEAAAAQNSARIREPTMAEVIVEVIEAAAAPVRANYVSDAVTAKGWASSSVRKTLTGLVEKGRIERASRGLYQVPQMTPGDVVDATSPGSVTSQRAGGDDHAEPPATAQDHDSSSGGRDDRDLDRQTDERVAIEF